LRQIEANLHAHCIPSVQRDGLLWLAIWNTRRSVAYALDFCPNELVTCELELRRARRETGDRFAGPFNSQRQAKSFAVAKLIKQRDRLDQIS
jgi:hypothetical protein